MAIERLEPGWRGGPESSGGGTRTRVGFEARPRLTWLLIKNFLLTIVTLGFYRFWARVRVRRYFWSTIRLADEPLEYTGTGLELFIGFLIAIAVIAPFGIAYVVLKRISLGNPLATGALSAAYFAFLLVFVQLVSFRARRYRLSRTAWRGIGARQTGSAWRYVGIFLITGLLTVVTLGICAPWNSIACQRYKIDNTWFGDSRFSVEAKAKDLLPAWLAVLALLVLPAMVAIGLNHSIFSAAAHAQGQAHPAIKAPHPGAFLLLLVTLFAGIPVLIAYWVAQFRYLASRTRLGEIRFHSAARGGPVVGRTILVGLALAVIFVVLGGGFIGVTAIAMKGGAAAVATSSATAAQKTAAIKSLALVILPAAIGFYVIIIMITQIIAYRFLRLGVLRHLATTLEIENFAAVEQVVQSSTPRQRFGIADSFEFGAF
jgi:uncharacterized membrane protein YjgN (DUF898 family)